MTTLSKTYDTVLVDMSATGARLTGQHLPEVNEELYLAAARVKTFGTVRWRSATECGVQFYEPLLQEEVTDVRREVARATGLAPEIKAALDDWVVGLAR